MRMLPVLGLIALVSLVAQAGEDDWLRPLGPPPQASPRRISGGEGVPPLPLPATPLRRSERKRDPSPPTLLGKIVWGEAATFTYEDGSRARVNDWEQCPNDIQQLMGKASRWFGLPYRSEAMPLSAFHGDAERTPILLFNGSRTIRFSDEETARLREYVLQGGMLLFDSIAGSPYFYEGARTVVARAFPELTLRRLPPDHPVFHMLASVERVRFPRNHEGDEPWFEGVYVGSRLGAVISRFGLGVGWDDREVPALLEQAVYYDVESANRLGLNLLAYAIGYAAAGRAEARPEWFGALDEGTPTDEFVFAQIRHAGAWNVHPGAAAALLRRLRQETALRVSLKRVAVEPGRDDLSPFPVLFLAGLDDFAWDEAALGALRAFLDRGGTLLVSNGLGLQRFDAATRRELQRLLPDRELERLAPEHPVFHAVHRIERPAYTPAVRAALPELEAPWLEGIRVGGEWRVLYSPLDIEAAWLGCEYPLARAYESESGTQLGMNLIVYAMTH